MAQDSNEMTASLRFAINLGNPVLAQQQQDGELTGITIALARKIAAAMNRTPQFSTYDAAGNVVKLAASDVWDIAFLAIDPQRETELRFTAPYVIIEGTVMVPKNSSITRVEQIDSVGNVINVGKNAAYDLYLSRHMSKSTLQRYSSSKEAIDMFIHGQGDMVAGIRQVLAREVQDDDRFRVLPDSFTEIRQAICVPALNDRLYTPVCDLLKKWEENGELQQLVEEFVTGNISRPEPKK